MEKVELAPKEWWSNAWSKTDLEGIHKIATRLRSQEPIDKKTAWRAAETEYIAVVKPVKWKGKLNARVSNR